MLGQGPLQWLPKGRTPACSTCAIPCSLLRHIGVLPRRTLSSQHAHVSLPWVPPSSCGSMPVLSLCHRHVVAGGAAAAALKCQVGCAFPCRRFGCMCSKACAYASYDAAHPGGPLAVTILTACAENLGGLHWQHTIQSVYLHNNAHPTQQCNDQGGLLRKCQSQICIYDHCACLCRSQQGLHQAGQRDCQVTQDVRVCKCDRVQVCSADCYAELHRQAETVG